MGGFGRVFLFRDFLRGWCYIYRVYLLIGYNRFWCGLGVSAGLCSEGSVISFKL